jgi:hypothetical protein
MDAERRLKRLCRRYRLPYDEAEELLPLLERALSSRPEVRRCLEAVVETALATRAAKHSDQHQLKDRVEQDVLVLLAGLLHSWDPGPEPG